MIRSVYAHLTAHLTGSKECYRKYENYGGLISHAVKPIRRNVLSLGSKVDMARTITHQGYTIQSTPHETDGDKWRLHIRISLKGGGHGKTIPLNTILFIGSVLRFRPRTFTTETIREVAE